VSREVNISLRGYLDELPTEVGDLLVVTLRKMSHSEQKLNSVIERLEGGEDVGHCIVDLENTRQQLYKIDSRINDCMSILAGYLQYVNDPNPEPPEREESLPEQEGDTTD
jgi:hypothetical protein